MGAKIFLITAEGTGYSHMVHTALPIKYPVYETLGSINAAVNAGVKVFLHNGDEIIPIDMKLIRKLKVINDVKDLVEKAPIKDNTPEINNEGGGKDENHAEEENNSEPVNEIDDEKKNSDGNKETEPSKPIKPSIRNNKKK